MTVGFTLRRVGGALITLFVSSFIIFASLHLAPGDPIAFLTGGRTLPPEAVAGLREHYHLDDPFLPQYWQWLKDVVTLDFGESIRFRQEVSSLVGARVGRTAFLIAYSAILVLIFAIPFGAYAGLRGGRARTISATTNSILIGIPPFVAGPLLIYVFGVELSWFPTFGAGEGFFDRAWHMTLPALALAMATAGYVASVTQAAVEDELGRGYVETATTRGIPKRLVIRRHILRNAMIPIVTVGALVAASLIAGTVVIEYAFSLGGLGQYLVDSVQSKDFAAVQAVSLLLVLLFVTISTIVDLLYAELDPRIRASEEARL